MVSAGWAWRLLVLAVAAYAAVRLLGMLALVAVPIVTAVLVVAMIRPLAELLGRRMSGPAAALVTLSRSSAHSPSAV
jgi:hypothetical protein